jgi:regulatory protein
VGRSPGGRPRDAFDRALEALGRKERTSAEMRRWLTERGFEAAEVEDAMDRLVSVGELDDEAFARRYADDKRELSGWGPERIREALLARGLPGALVESALGGDDPEAVVQRAAELLAQRGRELADDAERTRALAFLVRRGYPYEVAYDAIREHGRRAA